MATEVEYKGIKFSGGKLLIILPLLGTILGSLWGGFELWHRYQSMEKKINSYVSPDLSGIEKKIATLRVKLKGIQDSVGKATEYTRDIKNDLKNDLEAIEKQVTLINKRSRSNVVKVRSLIDKSDTEVRNSIDKAQTRFDNRREQIRKDMDSVESSLNRKMKDLKKSVDKQIEKALTNPLAKMRK